ncbi:MAG: hypothetical protein JNM80_10055 [Phycisphaerae bacterium]|nr:hypothetical protein [Phycisphaerae bacterium]
MPLLRRASIGFDHALALAMDPVSQPEGRFGLLAWGHNGAGQANIPLLEGAPWFIPSGARVIDMQAGEQINIVLFDTGQIAAWGDDRYGVHPIERPNGPLQPPLYRPYLPPAEWRFRAIVCCGHAVAALQYDHTPGHTMPELNGRIICWGTFDEMAEPLWWGPNYRGTLPQQDPANIPTWLAPYSPPYAHLAAAHHTLIAVKADGTPHIWGTDLYCPRTDQPRVPGPSQPPPIPMADIVGGYASWIAGRRADNGEIVAWGGVGNCGVNIPSGWPAGALPDHFIMARGNCNQTQALARCYDANCDGSQTPPVLSINDFICFGNAFAEAQNMPYEQQVVSYANCDGSIWPPVLNVNDYQCASKRRLCRRARRGTCRSRAARVARERRVTEQKGSGARWCRTPLG